ncbi:MAG: Maf family nucleotide pyrophosphatase [Hyphomicrobium sp.]
MSPLFPSFFRKDILGKTSLRLERAKSSWSQKSDISRPKLVLASASPRRLMLLEQVGIRPDSLRPSSIDETPKKGELPRSLVMRLSKAKAEAARESISNDEELAESYILAADTVVASNLKVFGKPSEIEEATAYLAQLSGRSHRVLTSVCLITPRDRIKTQIVETKVRFKYLSSSEIEAYVASREWKDKAGGYAIQGLAGSFVQKIEGSYTNVVGLPVTEVVGMLVSEGFPIHFNWMHSGTENAV